MCTDSTRLNRTLSRMARLLTTVGLLQMLGCTELNVAREPAPQPLTKAPLALPLDSHRFRFDPRHDDVVGEIQVVEALPGESLPDIARRFNLGFDEIRHANPDVDTWLPGVGTKVVLPTRFVLPNAPRVGVVINLAAMRLYRFLPATADGLAEVITHPVGIGREGWRTPLGATKVTRRVVGPKWYPPASIRAEHRKEGDLLPAVVPAGPDNPLGTHALKLGWPSYLIHGTNKAYGVGMRSSHGCIRLYPEDILVLFETVPVGTPVVIVNQPFPVGRAGNELVLQAVGPLADDKRAWRDHLPKLFKASLSAPVRARLKDATFKLDWEHLRPVLEARRGIAVPLTNPQISIEQAIAAAPRVENVLPRGATWDGKDIESPVQANDAQ